MKIKYIAPETEIMRVCGNANILDNKFGNSGNVPTRGDTGDDDDYDFQGSKQNWGRWEEETSDKENPWKE